MPVARSVGKSTHFTVVFCTTGGDGPRLTDVRFFFGHIASDEARSRFLLGEGEEAEEIVVRHFDAYEQGSLSAVVESVLQLILRDPTRRRRAEDTVSGVLRRIIRELPGSRLERQADAA